MKKAIFVGILIFSLALNAAVAATVGWYYWKQSQWASEADKGFAQATALTTDDVQTIRQMWPRDEHMRMMDMRRKIMAKNAEVIDAIVQHPGDMGPADQKIRELMAVRGEMEREAFSRMSTILATLPPDKRESFAQFIRTRCCMGRGMGRGMGPGMGPGMGRGMGPGYGQGPMEPCPVQGR
jgi:hypothetical protein